MVLECNVDLNKLYSEMSKAIHGYPWRGEAVAVNLAVLDESQACAMKQIVKAQGLNIEGLNEQ